MKFKAQSSKLKVGTRPLRRSAGFQHGAVRPLISTRLQPGVTRRATTQPLQRFPVFSSAPSPIPKPLKRLSHLAAHDTRLKPGANESGAIASRTITDARLNRPARAPKPVGPPGARRSESLGVKAGEMHELTRASVTDATLFVA